MEIWILLIKVVASGIGCARVGGGGAGGEVYRLVSLEGGIGDESLDHLGDAGGRAEDKEHRQHTRGKNDQRGLDEDGLKFRRVARPAQVRGQPGGGGLVDDGAVGVLLREAVRRLVLAGWHAGGFAVQAVIDLRGEGGGRGGVIEHAQVRAGVRERRGFVGGSGAGCHFLCGGRVPGFPLSGTPTIGAPWYTENVVISTCEVNSSVFAMNKIPQIKVRVYHLNLKKRVLPGYRGRRDR